ncbi:MAG: response regulator transcription factor, partial [Gammaproteobacteria bacterium]|nr:response regulator transcription factor [Gammaproteobacteria bacterium]
MRVALLEDDPAQSDLVRLWLSGAGHICHAYDRSREFMRVLAHDSFDLLVLDWELPDVSGVEVLTWARANGHESVPVLFTTARDEERGHRHGRSRPVRTTTSSSRCARRKCSRGSGRSSAAAAADAP